MKILKTIEARAKCDKCKLYPASKDFRRISLGRPCLKEGLVAQFTFEHVGCGGKIVREELRGEWRIKEKRSKSFI